MATFFGTAGNDTLTGTNTSDQFFAGAGNDIITTNSGIDAVSAGAGNDILNLVPGDSGQGEADADIFRISAGSNPGLNNGTLTIYGDYAGLDNDVLDVSALIADGWTLQTIGTTSTDGQGFGFGQLGYHGRMVLTKPGFADISIVYNDIESFITTAPVGPVDGLATGEVMGPGYTDAQGDQIDGGDGLNDTILGNGGNDTIDAGAGNDTVDGGADNDSVTGGAGNDSVTGGTGTDTLAGGAGNDVLDGGAGDDDIAVGGSDTAAGGSGDDVFTLDATDPATDVNVTLDGGTDATSGNPEDAANGNAGDILDLSAVTAPVLVALTANPETGTVNGLDGDGGTDIAFTEIERILTGSGNDTITGGGSNGPVIVDTGAGNDSITTGTGNDVIAAGSGNDTVAAGGGDDIVAGGDGNDSIAGGDGADTLEGGNNNDSLSGGAGNDGLIGGAGTDTLIGGEGADTLDGGLDDDDLVVGAGDQALGGAGDDVFTIDSTLTGNSPILLAGGEASEDLTDPANGGAGDVLDLRGLNGVVVTYNTADPTYNPATGVGESGTATYLNALGQTVTVNFSEIETVLRNAAGTVDGLATGEVMGPGYTDAQGDQIDGGDGLNDTILGNGGNDTIDAGAGNDTVDGGADNDSVTGGAGNDSVTGGTGTDTLAGGAGNDVLDGGAGDDDIAVGGSDTAAGGSGDDVFTLDATDPATDVNVTLDGGTDATSGNPEDAANGNAGDILDLSAVTAPVLVALTANPETGTVNGLDADGGTDIAFTEIERILTGSGNDTITGGGSNGPVIVDTGAGNDSITTGTGNDVISSGPGDDTVASGGGDDSVTGGDGNDSLVGGGGSDTLDGGNNNDTLDGGTGNDSLTGGDGADVITSGGLGVPDIGYPGVYAPDSTPADDLDTVFGGAGADTISTGDDRDLVYGGIDADSIDGGLDNDSLYGDAGADTIEGGEGADLIYGGTENDVIYGGLSNPALDAVNIPDATDLAPTNGIDTIYGGDGNDLIIGQDDADQLYGDAGADTLDGGIDNDSLYGGASSDSLTGGDGRDLLDGGAGVDILAGGTGADRFIADGTSDSIVDFDITTGIGDADRLNNDNVDLSAYYNDVTLAAWNAANPGQTYNNPLDWLRADQADGILQSAGSLRILNGGAAVAASGLTTENTSVICFVRGTRITTNRGPVAIEELVAGDMVLTVDNGYQPIRWIGSRRVDGSGKFAPIRFEAGVLMNEKALTVSPQHRVQITSAVAAKMFGSEDVLVAAKHLLGLPGVTQVPMPEVEYFHFLLDKHELVLSEGAITETLFTGPEALRAVDPAARDEILSIFPDLADIDHVRVPPPVRPLVPGRMGRQLAARHLRNNKRLVA